MRTKTVKRYYCDFCRKAGQRKDIIVTHEKHCTGNPARVCRMCSMVHDVKSGEHTQADMADLVAAAASGPEQLRTVAGDCPACILAGILNYRKSLPPEDEEKAWALGAFIYAESAKELLDKFNALPQEF